MNLNQIEAKFKELQDRERQRRMMNATHAGGLTGSKKVGTSSYFEEVMNDFYIVRDTEKNWNDMGMDKNTHHQSQQFLANAINHVTKKMKPIFHNKKLTNQKIKASALHVDRKKVKDKVESAQSGKRISRAFKTSEKIDEFNESAEFESNTCRTNNHKESKKGRLAKSRFSSGSNIGEDQPLSPSRAMSTHNLLNVEADLKNLQDNIQIDEKMFRNWNMKTVDKRAKVRNEAATMILKNQRKHKIGSLERPRMKKIRYLLDPIKKVKNVVEGEIQIHSFPMNNNDFSAVPKIYNIPKNNYDDRGLEKINEKAKIEVTKHMNNPRGKTRNIDENPTKKLTCVKTEKEPLKVPEEEKVFQIFGNEAIINNPSSNTTKVKFYSKPNTQRDRNTDLEELDISNKTQTKLPTVILSQRNPPNFDKKGHTTERFMKKDKKVYEDLKRKPFKSVSEYFKILEAKTGVKFDHPMNSPPRKMDSSLLVRNHPNKTRENLIQENVLLFKHKGGDTPESIRLENIINTKPRRVEDAGEDGLMLAGHNPHWKLLQSGFIQQNTHGDIGHFMDFNDYSEIDKHLRMAINEARKLETQHSFTNEIPRSILRSVKKHGKVCTAKRHFKSKPRGEPSAFASHTETRQAPSNTPSSIAPELVPKFST
ncbi:unnamed protein product [Moneuplotes crassus]|uniref:Uncharacterized protein n=1 Tax=Euplotes crassus TaxID=5936 RepID=A0AAD1Y320_EUPCR|nr:unnamed protein product [Moneuplotes crassus]